MENQFVWTDALVAEYGEYYRKKQGVDFTTWGKCILESFKESKQPKKDWEIVSFLNTSQDIVFNRCEDGDFRVRKGSVIGTPEKELIDMYHMVIYSVKRLSDNEVFSLGDKLNKFPENENIIDGFDLKRIEGGVWVSTDKSKGYGCVISVAKKLKEPIPLFTTEDGVPIFESDDKELWHLSPNMDLSWSGSRFLSKQNRSYFKIFSTKEAAEEYIMLNKPFMSIQNVMDRLNGYWHSPQGAYENLQDFYLKSKLNK